MTPVERRELLARELTRLAGMPPGTGEISDDRVAAMVATGLLTLPSSALDELIRHALAAVGLQRGVDRAYYYRLDEAAGSIALTHEWHAPGLTPLGAVSKYAQMPMALLPPSFLANLKRGGMLRLPSTRQFLGGPIEQLVAPDGDRALALVPVLVDGLLVGVAGFAAAAGAICEEKDLVLLQVVAQGVARAVERGRIDRALAASEARFRATCEASPFGIFLAGPRGECLYVNAAGQRIMGLSAADAHGRGWMSALHPDDREAVVSRWGFDGRGERGLRDAGSPLRSPERRGRVRRGAGGAAGWAARRSKLPRHSRGRDRAGRGRGGAAGAAARGPSRRGPRPRPRARRRRKRAPRWPTSSRASPTPSWRSISRGATRTPTSAPSP